MAQQVIILTVLCLWASQWRKWS